MLWPTPPAGRRNRNCGPTQRLAELDCANTRSYALFLETLVLAGGTPEEAAPRREHTGVRWEGGGGYWAPLTHKRRSLQSAHPRHTNHWAPQTRKQHQQGHRPQRPTERSAPTQHAKGRTGDCPGPRKGTTTRRNVTQGGYHTSLSLAPCPIKAFVVGSRQSRGDSVW